MCPYIIIEEIKEAYMEYIYALAGARKVAIYDEGNNILAAFIGKSRNVQWLSIEHDYRAELVSILYRDEICIAYISVANELVYKKAGGEERLVLFADLHNALSMRNISFHIFEAGLYILYITTSAKTGADELWCISPENDRKGKRLLAEDEGIASYRIIEYENKTYIIYDKNAGSKIYELETEFVLCEKEEKTLCELKAFDELRHQYEQKEKEYKLQYKKQYDELAHLTEQIQEEGRKWRDLYLKSIKKHPT